MKAKIIKDLPDDGLAVGRLVECDMQMVATVGWSNYYRVYVSDMDFEGTLVPLNAVESLDEEYIALMERIRKESYERDMRFVSTWKEVVVIFGVRGGVKSITYLSNKGEYESIPDRRGRYFYNLLLKVGTEHTEKHLQKGETA